MIFRHVVDGETESFEALAQRLDSVFLGPGNDDQAACPRAGDRSGEIGLVLALVLGAEDKCCVIVLAVDLRFRLDPLRQKLPIERPEALDGAERGGEASGS